MHVKKGVNPYQATPKYATHTLQEPFKQELDYKYIQS